ncbi:beta-ketoacyl-ACP synthase III [Lentzea aerocolonigenes]|uniref:beta-ketoacyl-ACP synthase III n=1 Tax=Lentzea aerocolonigenes TaxID=68170 RepID=UPI000562E9DF|nr:beta-ketoacyl-ACP synthase III [Lentzea aerocolonigenes]MCP2248805.1 3-oxoacyl-[acyl-carrier-protein] synthase III (EC 2.3.1.41) [Lentzea aerocolonigenes]
MTDAAVIDAIGHHLPEARETNDELARRIDTSDEWIRTRTGIRARSRAGDDEPTSVLATRAGREALGRATNGGADVDTVIVATTTPDMKCPATAPVVASDLGLENTATFDINSACTGFLAGLATAAGLITSGNSRAVLLVGAEKYSSIIYPQDRGTSPIFGDGAAAMVLRPGYRQQAGAIGRVHLGSDGRLWALAHVLSGGSAQPLAADPHDPFLRMDGRATYRHAVARMTDSCQRVLKDESLTAEDVDLLVAHQANARILTEVARELEVPAEKALVDLTDIGNTAAASIPVALSRAQEAGVLRGGETVLLTAFGAGASWGSTVLRWPELTSPNLTTTEGPNR